MAKYQRLHGPTQQWHNGDETSWSKEQNDVHPYHYMHGVTIWAATRDVNPDDRFLDPIGLGASPDDEPDDGQGEGQDG